jgi:predicted  nucleic acid-binding Zn-ribbon protein
LEEISLDKIKKRIAQKLPSDDLNLIVPKSGDLPTNKLKMEARIPSYKGALSHRMAALILKRKNIILKVPLLNIIARKTYKAYLNDSFSKRELKRLIRKIPFFGFVLWWTFNTAKMPAKMMQLSRRTEKLEAEIGNLTQFILKTDARTEVLSRDLEISADNIKVLSQNMEASMTQTQSLSQSLQKIELKTEDLSAKFEAAMKNLEVSSRNIECLSTDMKDLMARTLSLSQSLQKIEAKTDNNSAKQEILSRNMDDLKMQIRNLSLSVQYMDARAEATSGKLEILAGNIDVSANNIKALSLGMDVSKTQIQDLGQSIQQSEARTNGFSANLEASHKKIEALSLEIAALSQIHPMNEIKDVFLTRGLLEADSYLSRALGDKIPPDYKLPGKMDEAAFYYTLENLFRGEPAEIEKRQSLYLPYIAEANDRAKGSFFLDLGCGRGEFLTLLRQNKLPAKGVDINRLTIDKLKTEGYDAVLSDGLAFMEGLEDNALKGLTLFQVIEHLDFDYLKSLLASTVKKISRDGLIILESVNPHCPEALGSFYLDPTHLRPFSPEMVKILLEWYGFKNVQIIFSMPLGKKQYYSHVFMNYQTYAVIGKKHE